MLSAKQITAEAGRLHQAESARRQVRATTTIYPEIGLEDAYAIQRAGVELKLSEGEKIIGHKIGLTSRAMQMQMQIDEPDYGTLLDSMLFAEGSDIVAANHLDPRLEVELAFILKDQLAGADVTLFDVLNATDYVIPAFELIAARSYRVDPESGRPRTVYDTIADNAANAGIIIGGHPVRPNAIDLRWVGATCSRNGIIEETGLAAGVLNHPANGVCWLAKRLAPHNIALQPGQIILSGSFIRPVAARQGDTFHADFGPLGAIACHFV
jgi:2-oxo-hept-3-ene-1,7-dioate hydratase